MKIKRSYSAILVLLLFALVCNAQSKKTKPQAAKPQAVKSQPAKFQAVKPKAIQPKPMIPLSELKDSSTGWEVISGKIMTAKNKVEVLAKEDLRAENALYEAQIPESSPLGAIIYNSGGILIDGGWIRILGSGCITLNRSVAQWNKGKSFTEYGDKASYILVADDVLGGMFAINKGGIDKANLDMIYYYGPNSLTWLPIGLDYPQFLSYCFRGNIKDFYQEFYWKDWQTDVKKLSCSDVVSCFPLMWTKDKKGLMQCNRKVVSIEKQWSLYHGETKNTVSKPSKSKPLAEK